MRDITRSVLAMLPPPKRRDASPYSMTEHGPHQYIAALRPRDKVTEFGYRS
jgi:hypothetical protein